MKQIESPAAGRSGPFRTLLMAAPLALIAAGQAAAESPAEPEPRVPAVAAADTGVESASQPGRERAGRERAGRERSRREQFGHERMARGFDRRSEGAERRARRRARRDGGFGPAAWFGRRMAAGLDLTEEQRDRMREAMREISDSRRASRREVADARRSFRRAVRDPEQGPEEIQALGEALGRAQADQALQRRSERERIAGILTEEQRERLEDMRERRGRWGQGARNNRRRG